MGMKYQAVDTSNPGFWERLMQTLLVSGGTAAVQGGVQGSLENYFDNIKADRLREEAGNQAKVTDLAADTKAALLPVMGPLEYQKIAALVKSNPEMATEATPDWSGDRGRLLPKDDKIWMGNKRVSPEPPGAFVTPSALVGESGQPFLKGMQKGPGAKENRIGVGSPLEDWAQRNPGAAEWASEPTAKRARDQKTFFEQMRRSGKQEDLKFKGSEGDKNRSNRLDAARIQSGGRTAVARIKASAKDKGAGSLTPSKDPKFQALKSITQMAASARNNPVSGIVDPPREQDYQNAKKEFYDYATRSGQTKEADAAIGEFETPTQGGKVSGPDLSILPNQGQDLTQTKQKMSRLLGISVDKISDQDAQEYLTRKAKKGK